MNRYYIELTKTIVVEIEAENTQQAQELARDLDSTAQYESSWAYVEPKTAILEIGGPVEKS